MLNNHMPETDYYVREIGYKLQYIGKIAAKRELSKNDIKQANECKNEIKRYMLILSCEYKSYVKAKKEKEKTEQNKLRSELTNVLINVYGL